LLNTKLNTLNLLPLLSFCATTKLLLSVGFNAFAKAKVCRIPYLIYVVDYITAQFLIVTG